MLYPLFGLGANVAQFASGQILRNVRRFSGEMTYGSQLKFLVNLTIAVAVGILALHHWLDLKFVRPKLAALKRRQEELGRRRIRALVPRRPHLLLGAFGGRAMSRGLRARLDI